ASEDDISHRNRQEYVDDDDDSEDDRPLIKASSQQKPNERLQPSGSSNLIFDAGRDDEVAARGKRPSDDLTLDDINPQEVSSLFNPMTPRDYPSPAISPGRKTSGKRKDLKVRFKDEEEKEDKGDDWANEGSSAPKPLDFR
ncbi:hypothetical protein FRC01_009311, partial [Tulasnella sp. 417]